MGDVRRIGVLQAGAPPEALSGRGAYGEMTLALLGPGFVHHIFDVQAGELPGGPEVADAYVVTGSSAGVYDALDWIAPLKGFLQAASGCAKLVGVCFGHQLMAEAFGGVVAKSHKGWGIGLHAYDLVRRERWMDDGPPRFAIPASHQDQVIVPPPRARVVAESAHAPFAALAYADHPAISFQGHPEFAPAFAQALIESRRGDRFSDAEADRAVASLREPHDLERVGGWIRRFLEG